MTPPSASATPSGSPLPAEALGDKASLRMGECPLCGQFNQCAVAQGLDASQCWCMQAAIDPAALARIPAAARRQQCLCPQCGSPTDAHLTPASP